MKAKTNIQLLQREEINQVNGGLNPLLAWAIGELASATVKGYVGWVTSGAGGWKENYYGQSFSDPLL